jgi:hypothetical protein
MSSHFCLSSASTMEGLGMGLRLNQHRWQFSNV